MSQPHVCSSCRLQARLHAHLLTLRLQRRGFSHINAACQPLAHNNVVESNAYLRRRSPRQDYNRLQGSNAPFRINPNEVHQNGNGNGIRPYLGQPLQPEELLKQLDTTALPKRGDSTKTQQLVQWDHWRASPGLASNLSTKCSRFILACNDSWSQSETWRMLQLVVEDDPSGKYLARLGQYKLFAVAYRGFVLRSCRAFVERNEAPRPSELINLLPRFQIRSKTLWPRTLWETATAIVECTTPVAQHHLAYALEKIEELMLLWNQTMATHLRRANAEIVNLPHSSLPLDWSFLPDQFTLLNMLGEKPVDGRPDFAHALSMLLPEAHLVATKDRTKQSFDYASAALVTLDLLHRLSLLQQPAHAPFVQLLQAIRQIAPVRQVPPALWHRMTGIEYESQRKQWSELVARQDLGINEVVSVPKLAGALERHQHGSLVDRADAARGSDMAGMDKRTSEHDPAPQTVEVNLLSSSCFPQETTIETADTLTDHFVTVRINRISQAQQKQNLALAEKVKDEIFRFAANPQKPKLPDELYERLLFALLSLRNPKAAIEVWNHFIQSSRQPTAKTYTIMMRGSQYVRDLNGMENFWRRMRKADVQPDAHAWSTLVSGLIRGGRVEAGLEALAQMAREWFEAAKTKNTATTSPTKGRKKNGVPEVPASQLLNTYGGDIDGVPRPSLVVMNSAISALAARQDSEIPKVLAWGRTFSLEPDQTTYNVLLNILMRHGQDGEAIAVLKRMQDRRLQVDSSTWNVLLTSLFENGNMQELSHEEQRERILAFIKSSEGATSAAVDEKGYALVIDRLLKYYQNTSAASAVLDQMISVGKRPTTYIYTILVTSYFQRQPPDLAAVEALSKQIQSRNAGRGTGLDSVFYDRMIEGYATHHQSAGIQPMLQTLSTMIAQGKKPSWRALELMARALADRGEWKSLLQIVDDVRTWLRKGGGEMHVGQREYGQRGFWEFILSTGLLRDERVQIDQLEGRHRKGGTVMNVDS